MNGKARKIFDQQVHDLYVLGEKSTNEIADIMNMYPDAILRSLKRTGTPRRTVSQALRVRGARP